MKIIIIALLGLSLNIAIADSYNVYDYQSGNSYNVYQDDDYTVTNGYNANTGSTWSQRSNSDGTYSGLDSEGNFYSGNNNTGSYINSGTGVVCIGHGATRVCD